MADRAQLDALVKRRDTMKATRDRLLGRLESARADLAAVEDECRKRGVPPEKLDSTIAELTRRFADATTDLSNRIVAAEANIKPFTEGSR
jgi:hypothetical protein